MNARAGSGPGGSAIEDLRAARRLGVALGVRPDGALDYATSTGALDPILADRLRTGRPAILRHLAEVSACASSAVAPCGRMATAAEARMWFLHRLDPHSTAYSIPTVDARAESAPAVAEAIRLVIGAHPALHSRFRQIGDWPWRFERSHHKRAPLVDLDDRLVERFGDAGTVVDPASRRFDLQDGPAIASAILRDRTGTVSMMMATHHIAVDAPSNELLRQRFAEVLAAVIAGRPVDLRQAETAATVDRRPRPFAEPAQLDDQWLDQLRGSGDPLATWRRSGSPWRQDVVTEVPVSLHPFDVEAGLSRLIQRCRVGPFTVVAAALAAALGAAGDLRRVALAFAVDDREPEDEGVVGLFVNTAVALVDLDPSMTWVELVGATEQAVLTAIDHRRLGFDRLAELVDPDRSIDRSAVTPILLTVRAGSSGSAAPPHQGGLQPRCELDVEFDVGEDGFGGVIRVPQGLFDEQTVLALAQSVASALEAMADSPDHRVDRLGVHAPRWTAGQPHADDVPLGIVSSSVQRLDSVASSDGRRQLTRRRLLVEATARARKLAPMVEPGDRVAVLVNRDADLPATLLAVWLAGASYVPLDHRAPIARQEQVLARSGASLVIAADHSVPLPPIVERVVFSGDEAAELADRVAVDGPRVSPAAEAYVLFTSGSTGEPKGVSITHGGLAQLVAWAMAEFGDRLDRVLASTGLTFDLSAFELFAPLVGDGAVRVVESIAEPALDPAGDGCTLVNTVPSALRAVAGRPGFTLAGVDVNLAGEALRRRDVLAIGSGIGRLRNLYGPSEVTTYASMAHVDPSAACEPTIGAPLPHVGGFIAGPQLRPVVEGVQGELVLGGPAVAGGYVADPRLTADRFRPDPYGFGDRVYLTGDLVTTRRGDLHFHGRADRQVKLSGQRVELDEIEVWLGRHPAVGAAGVVLGGGRRRLVVGHVEVSQSSVTEQQLRSWMADRLPPQLVCDRIVIVDALPLNPNGKVDHRALAGRQVPSPPVVTRPEGRREDQLAACWARVLGLDAVDVTTPFFDLGGSSLLLLALQDELRHEAGIDISVVDLLGHPTVRSLAATLDDPRPVGRAGQQRGERRRLHRTRNPVRNRS